MRIGAYTALLFFLLPCSSFAQTDSSDLCTYRQNIFLKFFLPKGIAEGVALRSYLRSNVWDSLRRSVTDTEAVNEIFSCADGLCNDNRTAALLATSIAVLEHKTIDLKLPFGLVLSIPLTMENQNDFSSRVSKLPSHIYDPKIPDVDKLQHFFFSAFFRKTLKMNWLVRLLGDGVEIGEDLFIVGGADDPRDRHANGDGRNFGAACELDELPMPGNYLTPNP
jgi:hypothetical protein